MERTVYKYIEELLRGRKRGKLRVRILECWLVYIFLCVLSKQSVCVNVHYLRVDKQMKCTKQNWRKFFASKNVNNFLLLPLPLLLLLCFIPVCYSSDGRLVASLVCKTLLLQPLLLRCIETDGQDRQADNLNVKNACINKWEISKLNA